MQGLHPSFLACFCLLLLAFACFFLLAFAGVRLCRWPSLGCKACILGFCLLLLPFDGPSLGCKVCILDDFFYEAKQLTTITYNVFRLNKRKQFHHCEEAGIDMQSIRNQE